MCDDLRTLYDGAIKYFEDALEEIKEILTDTTLTLDEAMCYREQQRHFITACAAMKACREMSARG